MSIDLEKTEYNYLLVFYTNLAVFDPMTSTFKYLELNERKEINLTISVLQRKLSEIMPKVQDRESLDANNKKDGERRISKDSRINI